ncbi:MAG: helix-turn-helix transcriptional regulator, partial [Actinobacteria bacterium]|nr:helix-turn-helix transcriptional regulator [Actinomycetota bacterium]
VEAAGGMARLHLARGEVDLAAATLERALLELETDLLRSAPLLALHVQTEILRGDLDMAATSAARLKWIARETGLPVLVALAQLNSGRVAAARGDVPVIPLREALSALSGGASPSLAADIHLALAGALSGSDPAAAITEARAALAIFERLGARGGRDEAAAALRGLGVSTRAGGGRRGVDLDSLSRREREVLPLIAEGLSNAEIASRLFITPRTAEHHVSSILAKLGMRGRAEVASYVARAPAG